MNGLTRAEYAILGWLAVRPMSGYDLKHQIDGSIAFFWNEGFSTIYPALKRLSEANLISEVVTDDDGHPSRRVWKTTALGNRELSQWVSQPYSPTHTRNELLLKVFFGAFVERDVVRAQVESYRAEHVRLLQQLEEICQQVRARQATDDGAVYRRMTSDLGLKVFRATIAWCDDVLREIDDLEGG